tara:strand:- start:69 stop:566 length:498 start_codon:yes stop_codon:yes gene_type:complete
MWVVIKYKSKEFKTLKNNFFKVLGNSPEYYCPKIKYQKYINKKLKFFEKDILDNYLVCKHEKFKDSKIINLLKNTPGLIYFLSGHQFNQKELNNFVEFCKSNEDSYGFLCQSFFNAVEKTKAKFVSGPFTQMMFDIVERKGKKLRVLLNNINVTITTKKSNLLYS